MMPHQCHALLIENDAAVQLRSKSFRSTREVILSSFWAIASPIASAEQSLSFWRLSHTSGTASNGALHCTCTYEHLRNVCKNESLLVNPLASMPTPTSSLKRRYTGWPDFYPTTRAGLLLIYERVPKSSQTASAVARVNASLLSAHHRQ